MILVTAIVALIVLLSPVLLVIWLFLKESEKGNTSSDDTDEYAGVGMSGNPLLYEIEMKMAEDWEEFRQKQREKESESGDRKSSSFWGW